MIARISAGQAIRRQNATGKRLTMNISGMPSSANAPCLRTSSYGGSPAAVAVAEVAERIMTSPNPVSSSAVETMSRNSRGTGAKT